MNEARAVYGRGVFLLDDLLVVDLEMLAQGTQSRFAGEAVEVCGEQGEERRADLPSQCFERDAGGEGEHRVPEFLGGEGVGVGTFADELREGGPRRGIARLDVVAGQCDFESVLLEAG